MKLFFKPLDKWIINQKFGENRACINNDDNKTVVTCDGHNPPEGYRSVYNMMKGHNGLDLFATRGTPVFAAAEGTVVEVSTEEERGYGVGILHGPFDNKYFKTRYWHMWYVEVKEGDKVKVGQYLGPADSTGYSSSDHLHFELKETDMLGNTINHGNGYFGAIDPEPYMIDFPASSVSRLRYSLNKFAGLVERFIRYLRKY